VLVMWVNHAHFEPIVRVSDGGASIQTIFTAKDDIIRRLYAKYGRECGGVRLSDVA